MDNTFCRQIHNNNILNMSDAQFVIVLFTAAVLVLIYDAINENK